MSWPRALEKLRRAHPPAFAREPVSVRDEGTTAAEWLGAGCLLFLASLAVTLPLLLHGPSCGHDFSFHLTNWMEAATQMRHGTPYPRWAATPAWNAGEPRFLFYPPTSWLFGALLLSVLPPNAVPAAFTTLVLLGAGLAAYRLARDVAPSAPSLLAATLYLAGPYALFTAFERTAYAELLAAAVLPLVLRAALLAAPTAATVAVPLALLWLTNAPAAVMGTYSFALLLSARLVWEHGGKLPALSRTSGRQLRTTLLGGALGLLLPAFYLLPAAFEQRWVSISMATIPNMRVEDNFLFGHTGDGPHDAVLHTASLLAVCLVGLTTAALACAWWALERGRHVQTSRAAAPSVSPSFPPAFWPARLGALASLGAVLAFLLTRGSLPLWRHVPEMAFLQFPWRLLAVLSVVCSVAIASAFSAPPRAAAGPLAALALFSALGLGQLAQHKFREACDAHEQPRDLVQLFQKHHGSAPTDEYTPNTADNDALRWDNPAWWLAEDPAAPAPGTVPNPAATIENYDVPPPLAETVSGTAPSHLELQLGRQEVLILNRRNYPAWQVLRNGDEALPILSRDDGLLAVTLPAGSSTVDLRWHRTPDVLAGDALSGLALATLLFTTLRPRQRSRKMETIEP